MHPFLDVSKLTDEEILTRLGKAYTYMNQQVGLGHVPTVASIKEVIQSLEDERVSRMDKMIETENKKKTPNAHEPIELGKIDKVEMSDIEEMIRKLI
jgi:hypothetical protein